MDVLFYHLDSLDMTKLLNQGMLECQWFIAKLVAQWQLLIQNEDKK